MVRLAKAAGISFAWLASGEGAMFASDQRDAPQSANANPDQKDVAVYDVKTSAGGGFLNFGEKIAGYITLPVDYIKKQLGVNPEDICAIFVDGDSMEPHFTTGDMILLDCSENARNSKGDGIYTFRIEDQLFVKRLQHQGTRLIAQSDNPAYEPWEISDHDKASMKILARVVGTFRNL
jgi:phage repressor protein C with HTH and peptisase S24 domain